MSWLVVARKDFEDAVRSKMLWSIILLFVLATAGTIAALDQVLELDADGATQLLTLPAGLIIPISALVAAYLAIAGERESGSIKILLGLPHTRRDVVVGKLLGRAGVVAAAVVVAFAVTGVVLAALYGTVSFGQFVMLTLLTVLFGTTFVGIAVGISATSASRSRAMASAVGVFVLFQILWDYVPAAIYYVAEGTIPGVGKLPAWYYLLVTLNPKNAYTTASDLFLTGGAMAAANGGQSMTMADRVIGEVPFYLESWFGLVVLAIWLVVPVALGYLAFERADVS
ncbi:ABC transporter permease subunit [Halorussus halophilus]|uniref:ABC transporter permease subunit n=1 Tax=Halorussus halophilus TaxID=2650975 RepID=UPI0013013D27|nr:ABC transporter permease subunit [Halorussus halophilus]